MEGFIQDFRLGGELFVHQQSAGLGAFLFSQLKFPHVQFPCTSLCGDQMYEPFWEAVCQLERCSLKVMGLTCDGLSANADYSTAQSGGGIDTQSYQSIC